MIIQSSNVEMHTSHEKRESTYLGSSNQLGVASMGFGQLVESAASSLRQADLSLWEGVSGPLAASATPAGDTPDSDSESPTSSILVMTEEGLQFRTREQEAATNQQQAITRTRLLNGLMEAISGRKLPSTDLDSREVTDPSEVASAKSPDRVGDETMPKLRPLALEMTFSVTETVEEYECSNFSSCGLVKTADGREIEFGLDLKMERSYSATRTVSMTQTVVFTDPLIVNFEGQSADLSDEKFAFDLDADGDKEMISYLTGSGGMLALDKNSDGVINDGTELFGALSGNGFADLAQYDEDGNNYIDEADSIFSDLKLWIKNEDEDRLEALTSRDIGAIYLGATETPFELKGEDNQHNGRVRSSGFYLTEAGGVGTVQQVDMVV